MLTKLFFQVAIAGAFAVGGIVHGIDQYLRSVRAEDQVRERMVGIVVAYAAPPAVIGSTIGVIAGSLLPLGKKRSDRDIATLYLQKRLRQVSGSDAVPLIEAIALLESDDPQIG